MDIDVTVLVVGAGPTGLLLASELHRRGVDCRIIDAHSAPLHWDRATVVHPRSLEVFESLGIVAPLLAAGVKQRVARLHSAGEILGEIDLSQCGSRYGFNIGISEEVTEAILTEHLQHCGGQVLRATCLVDLQTDRHGVVATIEHAGTAQRIAARWVIGCDGHRSPTRRLAGIQLLGHDIEEPWAVFDATAPGWPLPYEANYAYLDEIPVILTALPKQRWRVYLRPSGPDSDLVADAGRTLRRYWPEVGFDDVASPTRFHCQTKVAERFRAGRILLAGDAAHVCSPAQGHGMNSGLQDAFNLAWKLALVCRGYATPALLDSYEAERRPVAETVTASGDAAEQAQILANPAEKPVRDTAIRAVFANPQSRHHEAIAEAELDIDYGASSIVCGDANDRLAPGQRLPDTIGVHLADGEACLLHELAHRMGHVALLIGGPSAQQGQLAALDGLIGERIDPQIIDARAVLSAAARDGGAVARLSQASAARLGIAGTTLLVIRPDGHVGLRSDHDPADALAAYQSLLRGG